MIVLVSLSNPSSALSNEPSKSFDKNLDLDLILVSLIQPKLCTFKWTFKKVWQEFRSWPYPCQFIQAMLSTFKWNDLTNLTKHSYSSFAQKFQFCTKVPVLHQSSSFAPKFQFCSKVPVLHQKFQFCIKISSFVIVLKFPSYSKRLKGW